MAKLEAITIGEEGTAFYYLIGQAITHWSHVEDALFRIAATAFSPKDFKALAVGYMAIVNFRSKLDFVDRIFSDSAHFAEFATEWKDLREFVEERSASRNQLAHCRTVIFFEADEGRRYAIVPGRPVIGQKKASRRNPPAGSICVREIDFYSKQFTRTCLKLWSFEARIRGERDQFSEVLESPLYHRSLDQIAEEIRFMIGETPSKRAKGR